MYLKLYSPCHSSAIWQLNWKYKHLFLILTGWDSGEPAGPNKLGTEQYFKSTHFVNTALNYPIREAADNKMTGTQKRSGLYCCEFNHGVCAASSFRSENKMNFLSHYISHWISLNMPLRKLKNALVQLNKICYQCYSLSQLLWCISQIRD